MNRLTGLTGEDLLKDETVLISANMSWRVEVQAIIGVIASIVISLGLLGYSTTITSGGIFTYILYALSGLFFLAAAMIVLGLVKEHYSITYFLTNLRVVKRSGIFSKKIDYVLYSKIQNVKVSKNITERILDVGDIYIDVAGAPNVEMVLENIPDPEKFGTIILEKMKEKEEMRL